MAERPTNDELRRILESVGRTSTVSRVDPHPFDERGRPDFATARFRIVEHDLDVVVCFRRRSWSYIDAIEAEGWSAESFVGDNDFDRDVAYWGPRADIETARAWGIPLTSYHRPAWRLAIERRLFAPGRASVMSRRGLEALAGLAYAESLTHRIAGHALEAEDAAAEARGHLRAAALLTAMGVLRG